MSFNKQHFQPTLAYPADIFQTNLNINLQDFKVKFQLGKYRVSSGNMSFLQLHEGLKNGRKNRLQNDVLKHIWALKEEFSRYWADIDAEPLSWKLIRNPFATCSYLITSRRFFFSK